MLIRDKLALLEIAELVFDEKDSKFHFKSYRGMTVMKMPIPDLNKVLANKVIDLMLFLHKRDGYIDVSKLSEIANNLDKLEEELRSLNVRPEVKGLKDVQKVINSEIEDVKEDEPKYKEEEIEEETKDEKEEEDQKEEPNLGELLANKTTVEDVYGLYLWYKVSDMDFEDKLKRTKVSELERLLKLLEIEPEKFASRGAKAKLIVDKLNAM